MLNNNEECGWSDFLDEPLEFSLATLSKYMNLLITNGSVEKKEKGLYKITSEGRKRYFDLRFKDSFDRKLRYPPEIIQNKRNYDDIILWMLFNNDSCKWADFLEKPLSINNNSLSKNLNLLIKKEFAIAENMEYRITKLGEEHYSKMLKKYELDHQTILQEEIKRIEDIKKKTSSFLERYIIEDEEIKIVFLDLINHLDYSKIENLLSSEEDYYKLLLFLSINHPNRYPEYILTEDFSHKFETNITTLNFFIQHIMQEKFYDIKFFKLEFNDNISYYFHVDEKIDKMIQLILDENIRRFSYLKKLQPDLSNEEQTLQTINLVENIVDDICNKLFDEKLKQNMIEFLLEYVKYLYSKFQRVDYSEDVMHAFKSMVYKNIINLGIEDIKRVIKKKKLIHIIMKDFPKYLIMDEIKKEWRKQI